MPELKVGIGLKHCRLAMPGRKTRHLYSLDSLPVCPVQWHILTLPCHHSKCVVQAIINFCSFSKTKQIDVKGTVTIERAGLLILCTLGSPLQSLNLESALQSTCLIDPIFLLYS